MKDGTLTIEILKLDSVQTLLQEPCNEPGERDLARQTRKIHNLEDFAARSPGYGLMRDDILGKVIEPLLVTRNLSSEITGTGRLLRSWLDTTSALLEYGDLSRSSDEKVSESLKFHEAMQLGQYPGYTVFGTKRLGFLGYGAEGMHEGDIVCLIMGARVPFIIRPVTPNLGGNSTSQRWRLVGECYVQGLMEGEGMSMGEREMVVMI